MRDDLGVGFALEAAAARLQRFAQRLEIFDDPVVDQRDLARRMRVCVARRGRAVRCPARMRNADGSGRGVTREFPDQIREFALGAAADQLAILHGAHARAVIAAIFHPLQPIDEAIGDLVLADNSDNSAHVGLAFVLENIGDTDARHIGREILCIAGNQNAPAGERSGKDDGVHRLEPTAFAPQGSSASTNFGIDFIHAEAGKKRFGAPQTVALALGHHFDPHDAADPRARTEIGGAIDFCACRSESCQRINDDMGIKAKTAH